MKPCRLVLVLAWVSVAGVGCASLTLPEDEESGAADASSESLPDGAAVPDERAATDVGSAKDTKDGGGIAACGGARYCNDFESYALGTRPRPNGIGDVTVDGTRSVSGSKSLRVSSGGYLTLAGPALPMATNNVYGRMMAWFETLPPSDGNAWTMVRAQGGQSGQSYIFGGQNAGFLMIYYPGDRPSPPGPKIPLRQWVCIQWQANGSADPAGGTRDQARMWMNGAEMSAMTIAKGSNWKAPKFESVLVGVIAGSATVWYDDLVLDDKFISCPKPAN